MSAKDIKLNQKQIKNETTLHHSNQLPIHSTILALADKKVSEF
jgi:hypothetical protein